MHGWPMSRPLEGLRPAWLYERDPDGPLLGLEFDCPRCLATRDPREHRLSLWFVAQRSNENLTLGNARPRLYDHAGTRFNELTVWTERPAPRDPLIEVGHWMGYIEDGEVYDLPRIGGAP